VNIDEAVAFFEKFLTAVYEHDVANLTEPDDQLEQRVARTESFMYSSPGTSMTSSFMRPRGLSAKELAEIAERAAKPVRRPMYMVVEYNVPGWGTCFAANVGGGEDTNYIAYERQYWAMDVKGQPKIVAQYGIDFYAEGLGWENVMGAMIGPTGDPLAVRALEEPRVPRDRDNYQRIVARVQQNART
jgi:hypothetical protein